MFKVNNKDTQIMTNPPDVMGMENFEVVYFWWLSFFEILGMSYPLGGLCLLVEAWYFLACKL